MRFVVLLLLPTIAVAEDQPHLTAGMEIGIGTDATLIAARVHGGASHAFGDGLVRPSIGVGLTGAVGRLEKKLAIDTRYSDWGVELQLGVDIGDKQLLANRVFTTIAYTDGWRLGVGYNIAQFASKNHSEPRRGYLLLVMPQQMEVTWSRDRVAVTFSYGI
jgi:hypothetical protein